MEIFIKRTHDADEMHLNARLIAIIGGTAFLSGMAGFLIGRHVPPNPPKRLVENESRPVQPVFAAEQTARAALNSAAASTPRFVHKSPLPAEVTDEPELIARKLMELPAGASQISWMMTHLADEDPIKGQQVIDLLSPPRLQEGALHTFLWTWGRRDPRAALGYVRTFLPGFLRNTALTTVGRVWAESDGASAVTVLNEFPPGEARDAASNLIGFSWGEKQPQAAADYFLQNGSAADHQHTLPAIVNMWGNRRPREAIQWAEHVPISEERTRLLRNGVERLADHDPKAARDYMNAQPVEFQALVYQSLASSWARRDPDEAILWASTLADDQSRKNALSIIAQQWGRDDVVNAGKWLNTLSPGDIRDAAVGTFIVPLAGTDPRGAIEWALSIRDPELRAQRLEQTARIWMKNDPTSAGSWLNQDQENPLSKPVRDRLLKGG